MKNSINSSDEKTLNSLDESCVYCDIDGIFDCTLIKHDDNNQTIMNQIRIIIINEAFKYSLLIYKSDAKPIVDVSDSNIELVKSRFDSIFHNFTGNYWKYRDQFIKIPGNYYLFSNDLDLSSSSEEQQVGLSRMKNIPKFISNERAFYNAETKSMEQTYRYNYNGLDWEIALPEIPPTHFIIPSLLFIRKFMLRIGIIYENKSTTQIFFGSGCLITNELVLTCAHNFDPIEWEHRTLAYSKIYVSFHELASEELFSTLNPNNSLIEAKILRRGLVKDNLSNYKELEPNAADLAILILDKPAPHVTSNEHFDPQLNSSFSKSNVIPINSKLFLIGYNGELPADGLNPYRNLEGFQHLTIDKLNNYLNVNNKSISIGHHVKAPSENDQYSLHDCSTSSGSSGSIILDCYGRLAGINIGITNSRKKQNNAVFFNKETYNKYVSINSNQFLTFIGETILPNIKDDEAAKKWVFNSE